MTSSRRPSAWKTLAPTTTAGKTVQGAPPHRGAICRHPGSQGRVAHAPESGRSRTLRSSPAEPGHVQKAETPSAPPAGPAGPETGRPRPVPQRSRAGARPYRRLCIRMDKPKANTAHKLARMLYFMLTRGEAILDQGQQRYEEQQRPRSIASLKRRAAARGIKSSSSSCARRKGFSLGQGPGIAEARIIGAVKQLAFPQRWI